MPNPPMYESVRAIGTLRPKFTPGQGRAFSDELTVLGTGFWLRAEKVLITCAHVVQNLLGPLEVAGLLVVGKTGNYRRAVLATVDLEHDLAALVLVADNGQPIQGTELDNEAASGLVLTAGQYPDVSTPVAYAGFPLGNQLLNNLHSPTYAEGVVGIQQRQSGRRKEIQISGPIAGGFSGSPIVKVGTTELIGVVSNGPGSGTANIFMGISCEHVKSLASLVNS